MEHDEKWISRFKWLGVAAFVFFTLWNHGAFPHEVWADGTPVPPWVKAACCSVAHSHHLLSAQVHARADGYHIDGLQSIVPYDRALPSQDGDFWAFYPDGLWNPPIYCFYAPPKAF